MLIFDDIPKHCVQSQLQQPTGITSKYAYLINWHFDIV